ncbi:hypothetical protein PAXRUDRAFT_34669 [Paxillus rubicundulus Ve08.2h10]|uniref:Uncharacterized protein n=1 Tax=Paxillus rubicundulus Ve08.2h10 TaxID=930991 RepID=A0A0D0DTT0_9AGAM|nr:hypothetical protein PAXRUDRAFT_34669 [Paxillus rubicundulus Ve08.2h10]
MFSTAAALLFGLGTRIALDKFFGNASDVPNPPDAIGDIVLLGVVQGVALYYTLMEFRDFAFVVAFAIATRLAIEYMMFQDVGKCATTLLGVALGVLVTDVLSQLIEDGYLYDFGQGGGDADSEYGASSIPTKRRKRLVKFQSTTEYSAVPPSKPIRPRRQDPARKWRTEPSVPPSMTSSNEDMVDPHRVMDPLEREVATLRARASLADSERRRFKEEKKWALSQGNMARAAQMSWQVKRYSALTRSFTKEADTRLLEVTAIKIARQQNQQSETPLAALQNAERPQTKRHTNHAREAIASTSQQVFVGHDSTVTLDATTTRHRRQSSGNLKSAMRVPAR